MRNPDNETNVRLAQLMELFGAPPVVPDIENAASYEQMMRSFLECFRPQDFFETVLIASVLRFWPSSAEVTTEASAK